jgi:hypothetical protein
LKMLAGRVEPAGGERKRQRIAIGYRSPTSAPDQVARRYE